MGSSKKTITDLQIVDLLEAGTAEAEGRRNAIMRCQSSMRKYASLYTGFKKDYRKKYSAKFLDSIGYNPYTVAATKVLDKAAIKTWLIGKGYPVGVVTEVRSGHLGKYPTARHYLQEHYIYSNALDTLQYSGKTYKNLEVTNGGPTLHLKMAQWYVEALTDRLNTYGYDGTHIWRATGISTITASGIATVETELVTVNVYDSGNALVDTKTADTTIEMEWTTTTDALANGTYTVKVLYDGVEVDNYTAVVNNMQQYTVDTLQSTVYDVSGVSNYRATTMLSVAPYTVVYEYVPVEYFTVDIAEYSYEVLYAVYTKTGVVDEWFSYVENLDTVPTNLYVASTVNMTAILPMKESNVIYDATEIRRKRLLRKLGLQPKDLVESLQDANLDNAYIWTGLPISNTDQGSIKVMFRTFDYLAAGSGSMSISISQLSMNYSFTITKNTYSGHIMDVGTYSKTLTGTDSPGDSESSGSYSTLVLRYQGSETEWRELIVTNYINTYVVSGHGFTEYLTSSKDTARLIVPLDVLNGLRYREYVTVFESSLSMICYSITVVKVKWYQSSFFGFLLKIIAVVIAIYTWGSSSKVSEGLWAIAESIGTAVLKAVVVSVAINLVMQALGPELGALAVITAILVSAYTGNFGMSMDGFKGWLATATQVLNTMNQAIAMKTEELMTKSAAELKKIADESEEVQKALEGLRSLDNGLAIMMNTFDDTIANHSPNGVIAPDTYIAMMQGAAVYNYDNMYDVDSAIDRRKVVNSG